MSASAGTMAAARRASAETASRANGRERGRIDQAAAAVDEIIAHAFRTRYVGAKAAERLGEGADHDVSLARKTAPPLAQNPGGMRVVHDQHRVINACEPRDLRHRRDVAIHREHALRKNEFRTAMRLILSQKLGEMAGVAVPVSDLTNAGRLAAEMHAGVVQAVGEDERFGAEHASIEQRLQDRRIRLEAGRHEKRRGLVFQAGDLRLDGSE
jgi:hypothetical protein